MKPVLSMVLAGCALGLLVTACGGGSGSSSASAASAAPAAAGATTAVAGASDGSKVFDTNCSSCHGATGQGMAGAFPPLAGNPVVVGDPAKIVAIVKNGLTGKVVVKGASYNGQMPPWGKTLSNADIAAVITFARSSWGNKGSAVTEAQVAAVK